ncbi:type II secretion system protein GspM [Methylomonas sp. AM2-LC]|uniref:type II secretion system protein GspM n=1 Tax=Methylomonas sp. AM2-LC TaxID=3153301 RepID=UPI003263A5F1
MNLVRYHKWLAVGLLVMLLTTIFLVLILPLISSGLEYRDQKTDLLFRLQRQQKIAARKDSVAQNLETIKNQFQEQGYFSNRSTEALASADLQEIAKTAVTDAGGQLTSTQGLPGKMENGFNRVAVRVRMTANTETLRNVLHTFAISVPILIVDQLDITPIRGNGRSRPVGNKNDANSNSQLNVSFQVVSFMRSAAP